MENKIGKTIKGVNDIEQNGDVPISFKSFSSDDALSLISKLFNENFPILINEAKKRS